MRVSSIFVFRGAAVAFGNGVFVAITDTGVGTTAGIRFSPVTGTPGDWTFSGLSGTFNDVTFGNGLFVVASGTSVLVSSNFTGGAAQTISLPTSNSVHLVKYLTNLFVAFAGRELLTSTNAINWVNHGAVVLFAPSDVSYGNGRFVALSGTNFAFSPPLAANILQPAKPAGALTISGEPGRQYAIQAKDSLSITTWQSVATITLTNPPQSFADTNATNFPQRFYRTQLLP